ncbi:WD40-repeat-containing domain protein [Trichoderma sp. TUCIM 5745]
MAPNTVSQNQFGDFANVHNGNVYNNWSAGQAEHESDNVYLQDLRTTDPRLDKKRILDTKGPLLRDSYRWIFDHQDYKQWLDAQSGILWIKGDPGKGKTMLLCGIIESLEENEEAENEIAYFFCQATDSRINTATAILGGLTFYLARRKRSLLSYVKERHLSPGKPLFDGPNGWTTICDIFEAIIQDSGWSRLVLAVDALDECIVNRDHFLRLVVRTSSKVKWLLSSRNLEDIQRRLLSKDSVNPLSLELKENAESVSQAVQTYIDHSVAHMEIIQEDKELERKVRDTLQSKADNTFLWAALAVQQLQDAMKWEVLRMLDQMPEGLQSLYQLMMNQIQDHPIQRRDLCIKLLSIVTTAYRPLHLGELSSMWKIEPECPQGQEDVRTVARLCGSFLTVKDDTIYFIHQSAKDFVLQQGSQLGVKNMHLFIFKSSLDNMSQELHRNMYNLESPSRRIDEISTPCPDPLAYLQYQCVFWIDHLLTTSEEERAEAFQVYGSLYAFFTNVFLYWLEAISLLQATHQTIGAIQKLLGLVQDTPGLRVLTEDAVRFSQSNIGMIQVAPLQIYSSALAFAPECSSIRQAFGKHVRQGVPLVFNAPNTWGARVHTLIGHTDKIKSLAFSPTSRILISNSCDGTSRIWDMDTGNCQQTLLFGDYHQLVELSPDSKKVASSDSENIYIWKTDTGEKTRTLCGDGRKVCSIAFASDRKLLASAYADKTVCIWCTETGKLLQTLQHHAKKLEYSWVDVAFSPDLRYVVAAGASGAIIWDIEKANEIRNIQLGKNDFLAVTLSPNSKLLASAHNTSWFSTSISSSCINVWCIATGQILKSCRVKCSSLYLGKLAFSSNIELIIPKRHSLYRWRFQSSPDFDNGILVSNIQSPSAGFDYETFVSRLTIDFSLGMNLVAESDRISNTIIVWQSNFSDNSAGARGTSTRSVNRVAISPDSSLVALSSAGIPDTIVTLWRTDTGQCCQSFTNHACAVTAITFSRDSSIMVTGDTKSTLRFWEIATGKCINVLSVPEGAIESFSLSGILSEIAASGDLGILACGCWQFMTVLQKTHEKEYKCIAQYPVPRNGDERMRIEHLAVLFNSVFITWRPEDFDLEQEHDSILEYWKIDTDHPIELHVGDRHRSISYEDKTKGLMIPRHEKGGQTLATGEFAWITKNEERLLWIPKELRPWSSLHWDSSRSIIAIGVKRDNTMLIIDFSRQSDTIACEDGGIKSLKRKRRVSNLDATIEEIFEEQESV